MYLLKDSSSHGTWLKGIEREEVNREKEPHDFLFDSEVTG